jgi:diaminopimelate epimerase
MSDVLLKVEGAGNDFLLGGGAWANRLASDPELVTRLCHRRTGLGADGVLAVRLTAPDRARLIYRNADGSLARFCGNGTRCAARAAVERLGAEPRLVVETDWAPIPAAVSGSSVALELPPLTEKPKQLTLDGGGRSWRATWLRIGVPHLVVRVADLASVDPTRDGPPLRHHPELAPDGANINFVSATDTGLAVRTYERGVEDETLCCGSGVVAAALVAMAAGGEHQLRVLARSGDELIVETSGDPLEDPVRLSGPTRIIADIEPTTELLEP